MSNCTFDSSFIEDVTMPDNTVMEPGQSFVKTWRVKNTSSCDWGEGFQLVYINGILMGASSSAVPVPHTPVGATVDLSVEMISSYQPGDYTSIWRLQAPDGTLFGTNLIAQITVPGEASAPTPAPTIPISFQPTITPTANPANCVDNAAFVADINITDDTIVIPDIPFLKTWRLQNTGTCAWLEGYSLVFIDGRSMKATRSVTVPYTPATATADITVQMFSPSQTGTHKSTWRMRNPDGKFFGPSVDVRFTVGQTISSWRPEGPKVHDYPTPSYLTNISDQARNIYLKGQQLGNHKNVLAKVGDSITYEHAYLWPIGEGRYSLGSYSHLQTVIDEFGPSFTHESTAAKNGFTLWDLLSPESGYTTRIECEYKTVRPSVALIMIGTNDLCASNDLDGMESRLRQVLDITIDYGIVPVLSTIPDSDHYDVTAYNRQAARLAQEYSIPLLDYYATMQNLPNRGLSDDGAHPSVPPDGNSGYFDDQHLDYGYTMRNLTTLQMLDVLWNRIMY
jgi:hypothetical protein